VAANPFFSRSLWLRFASLGTEQLGTFSKMIDTTQRLLSTAKFFYRQLEGEQQRPSLKEPNAFQHYFTAFVVIARCVTWMLESEQREKYDAWLPSWEATLDEKDRELLKRTNEWRRAEVHNKGVNLTAEWKEMALHEFFALYTSEHYTHPAYGMHMSAQPGTVQPKRLRP
jgi:hypothetical protein